METQDGGDAKVEVSPRDIVYTQAADASEGEEPTIFYKLDLRYGYVCDGNFIPFTYEWVSLR